MKNQNFFSFGCICRRQSGDRDTRPLERNFRMVLQDTILHDAFLRWQCRIRQNAMRENLGRPDDGIMPNLGLIEKSEPIGRIITVLCKAPAYSMTSEMRHMFQNTFDPMQRRQQAVQFFSEFYYRTMAEFSDILTATFAPGSEMAKIICGAGTCKLTFECYGQRFNLVCTLLTLAKDTPLFQATWWHNMLFNPDLHPDTQILGFEPNWACSSAEPNIVKN